MTPVLMAVCLLTGFGLGWLTKRQRLGLLAENNHWLAEDIEALKGADLDADVAAERSLRLSGEQPKVELYDQANERQCNNCGKPAVFAWKRDGFPFAACNFCISLYFEDGVPEWVERLDAPRLQGVAALANPLRAVVPVPECPWAECPHPDRCDTGCRWGEEANRWADAVRTEDDPYTGPRSVPGPRVSD